MVRYLSARYERVHAIIGVNPQKRYDVSPYERQELFRAMLKEVGLANVDVIIVSFGSVNKKGLNWAVPNMFFVSISRDWQKSPDDHYPDIGMIGKNLRWSYIWKYAQQHGAKVMYRGLRSFQKDGAAEKFLEAQPLGATGVASLAEDLGIQTVPTDLTQWPEECEWSAFAWPSSADSHRISSSRSQVNWELLFNSMKQELRNTLKNRKTICSPITIRLRKSVVQTLTVCFSSFTLL